VLAVGLKRFRPSTNYIIYLTAFFLFFFCVSFRFILFHFISTLRTVSYTKADIILYNHNIKQIMNPATADIILYNHNIKQIMNPATAVKIMIGSIIFSMMPLSYHTEVDVGSPPPPPLAAILSSIDAIRDISSSLSA
jgi:hypothetical protein